MSQPRIVVLSVLAVASFVGILALTRSPGRTSTKTDAADAPALAVVDGVGAREVDSAQRVQAVEDPESRTTWGPDSRPHLEVPPEPPPPAVERPEVSSEPNGAPPAARAVEEQAAAAIAARQERATEQAAEALEGMRGGLADACWKGGKGSATFEVDMSFDAQGKLQASAISDARGAGAAVGNCLRAQPLAVEIEPPGESVAVKVPIRLP